MKNANTNIIEDMIQQFIDNRMMFTSYDITKQIRHSGYHIEHKNVQIIVRKFDFSVEDYKRNLHPTLNAFVYYYYLSDPDDYRQDNIPEFDVNKSQPSLQITVKRGLLDKRGRFTVSSKYVRNANFSPYSKVIFETKNNEIIIRQADLSDKANATVDKHSNIRVTRREFENAFNKIPSSSDLTVSVVQNNGIGIITISI